MLPRRIHLNLARSNNAKSAPLCLNKLWRPSNQTRYRAYATTTGFEVRPIAGALGAEVLNVDLSKPLSSTIVSNIRQALHDHLVIFFRSQNLGPEQYLSFTSHFGTPVEYPFVKGIDGYPTIINVLKHEHETTNFGGIWHSDTTYFASPPMGSVLLALEVPPYGGDTLFANQYLAYEALSPGMKEVLQTLKGVSTSSKAAATKTREDRIKDSGHKLDVLEAIHPVVRTHPGTGRKGLYINIAHTSRFEGWTEDESAPLLQYLFQHQVKPEFTCRFQWDRGSIAFWDNRCALHNPINDYHGFKRSMWRVTLEGDVPV
jgi:taurine dioxygenase